MSIIPYYEMDYNTFYTECADIVKILEIIDLPIIGSGSFSKIYKTPLLYNLNEVIVKKVSPYYKSEVSILQYCNHPNIIKYYHHIESKEHLYIFTNRIYGKNLCDILEEDPLPKELIIPIMTQLLETVKYLHENLIMHRDIKLENIMLTDNKITLLDFGFATFFTKYMIFKDICGSLHYISPEMYKENYCYTTDLWSLGIVFYIICSRKFPFDSEEDIMGKEPDYEEIDEEYRDIIKKFLVKHPLLRNSNYKIN